MRYLVIGILGVLLTLGYSSQFLRALSDEFANSNAVPEGFWFGILDLPEPIDFYKDDI